MLPLTGVISAKMSGGRDVGGRVTVVVRDRRSTPPLSEPLSVSLSVFWSATRGLRSSFSLSFCCTPAGRCEVRILAGEGKKKKKEKPKAADDRNVPEKHFHLV